MKSNSNISSCFSLLHRKNEQYEQYGESGRCEVSLKTVCFHVRVSCVYSASNFTYLIETTLFLSY